MVAAMACERFRVPRLLTVMIVLNLTLLCSRMAPSMAQNSEAATLKAAMASWDNGQAQLGPSWSGDNPCVYAGVICNANGNVINLNLANKKLKGPLPELQGLRHLEILDLSFNLFTGSIPEKYSSLGSLKYLMLKNNSLSGQIPTQLGAGLPNLVSFDVDENPRITGPIPESFGQMVKLEILHLSKLNLTGEIPPQLGQLVNLKELTCWGSSLSGGIPHELGALSKLEYLNLHTSKLRGNLPPELGNLTSLRRLWLYNNDFYGGIPEEWAGMVNLTTELSVRNNNLTGPVPKTIGNLTKLQKLDLFQNQFTGELPPELSTLDALTYLKVSSNYFSGSIPSLRSDITQSGWGDNNCFDISPLAPGQRDKAECERFRSTLNDGCAPCPTPGKYYNTTRPCRCRIPLEIWLYYEGVSAPLNTTLFQGSVATKLQMSPSQVVEIHQNMTNTSSCLLKFWLVPEKGDYLRNKEAIEIVEKFRQTLVPTGGVGYRLVNQTLPQEWPKFEPTNHKKSGGNNNETSVQIVKEKASLWPIFVGAPIGAFGILSVIVAVIIVRRAKPTAQGVGSTAETPLAKPSLGPQVISGYADRPTASSDGKRKQQTNSVSTFSKTGNPTHSQASPHSQYPSARLFTVQELSSACNGFPDQNLVGAGGHAKVYRGYIHPFGEVAVKRAKLRAVQGREFKNELDVLSRVHHRNLVRFLGCCEEGDEQMLVYEFMKNGTLHNHLMGNSGVLNWEMRLQIAIGTANGLTYLHNHADPPIVHRDVKPSNILLDENMKPKLGDFGISRMIDEPEYMAAYTRVAGTWGYLDPMYHESQVLTDKSDVYSFGVVLLELVVGKVTHETWRRRLPTQGMTMVDWVEQEYSIHGLEAIADPSLNGRFPYETMCRILEIGLWCTRRKLDDRPKMKEVLSALDYTKTTAEKEKIPEDGQTTIEIFKRHMFQTFGGRKPTGPSGPKTSTKVQGGRLFTEDQLLGGNNVPGTSYSTDSVIIPANYSGVEAR